MAKTIKVALAGAGAFGIKHLDGIKNIDGVEVVSLVGRELEPTKEVAAKYGIAHVTTELADSLALQGGRRRHPLHADADARRAGDRLPEGRQACAGRDPAGRFASQDAQAVVDLQKQTGLVAMCGHTRRFNPEPPVGAQEDRRRRVQHPADGRADLSSSAAPT